jgi:hypothetical protein
MLMPVERKKELRRRQQRKRKLKILKTRLAAAHDLKTKQTLLEKIKRIQPGYIPPN